MSLNWLNRRNEMAKIISEKYASKDSPIFTGRYTISNPKAFQEQIRNAKISTSQKKNKKPADGKEEL